MNIGCLPPNENALNGRAVVLLNGIKSACPLRMYLDRCIHTGNTKSSIPAMERDPMYSEDHMSHSVSEHRHTWRRLCIDGFAASTGGDRVSLLSVLSSPNGIIESDAYGGNSRNAMLSKPAELCIISRTNSDVFRQPDAFITRNWSARKARRLTGDSSHILHSN